MARHFPPPFETSDDDAYPRAAHEDLCRQIRLVFGEAKLMGAANLRPGQTVFTPRRDADGVACRYGTVVQVRQVPVETPQVTEAVVTIDHHPDGEVEYKQSETPHHFAVDATRKRFTGRVMVPGSGDVAHDAVRAVARASDDGQASQVAMLDLREGQDVWVTRTDQTRELRHGVVLSVKETTDGAQRQTAVLVRYADGAVLHKGHEGPVFITNEVSAALG